MFMANKMTLYIPRASGMIAPMPIPVILALCAFLAMSAVPAMAASSTTRDAPTAESTSAPAKPVLSPRFVPPVACALGTDCWVMNYLDIGPEHDGKATDPFCGARTYDGSKGTAFALRDILQMESGVNVLAARAGTVKRVRAGEADHKAATDDDLKKIREAKRECGNAVLIDHEEGLQTIYCHLKKESITVKPGDIVRAGDAIGQIGMSGFTRYPQLHFGILWDGAIVDPFTGLGSRARCGAVKRSLWESENPPKYEGATFYNGGFLNTTPKLNEIDNAKAIMTMIPAKSEMLSFWTTLFGVQAGDIIDMTITAPDGKTYSSRQITQENAQTRQLYFTGRKQGKDQLLKPGTYKGTAVLTRKNKDGKKESWNFERSVSVQGG